MAEQKSRLRYWLVGERWQEGWFLLTLIAGLLLGVQGLVSAVASYFALRTIGGKAPAPVAVTIAFAVATLTFFALSALLGRV